MPQTLDKPSVPRSFKERVLIEFPAQLIERADLEAERLGTSRSQLIREALEGFLAARERDRLEQQLAEGYSANNARNLELLEEFAAVDREIFQ
jgi:metal-responsive CopG/Arc/MetJ family transcriptional regulator